MSKGYELIADGLKMMAKGYEMLGELEESEVNAKVETSKTVASREDAPKMEASKEAPDLPVESSQPEVKKVDVKDVRALMRQKIKDGKMEECQEALHSFGCDKLTDVPEESLSELFKKVEVL